MINQLPVFPLICPVCSHPLDLVERTLRCEGRHSFDIAKEGYVNLMLGHKKGARIQGDEKEMLQARRTFLERGWYQPLSDAINQQVWEHLQQHKLIGPQLALVDLGCGEGHYLGRLEASLGEKAAAQHNPLFGLDIAKDAVRMASRRHRNIRFLVSDANRKLPFSDGSTACLLNIFSPRNGAEFARVIHPTGMLLVVIPNQAHLSELRNYCRLLQIEENKSEQLRTSLSKWFRMAASQRVMVPMRLETQSLVALVRMTPNYWHMSSADWERLESIPALDVTADFQIMRFNPIQAI